MKWISVKDYLPVFDEKVLVATEEGSNVSLGYYDPPASPETGWRCAEFMEIQVDFWMPLPKPPKENNFLK